MWAGAIEEAVVTMQPSHVNTRGQGLGGGRDEVIVVGGGGGGMDGAGDRGCFWSEGRKWFSV